MRGPGHRGCQHPPSSSLSWDCTVPSEEINLPLHRREQSETELREALLPPGDEWGLHSPPPLDFRTRSAEAVVKQQVWNSPRSLPSTMHTYWRLGQAACMRNPSRYEKLFNLSSDISPCNCKLLWNNRKLLSQSPGGWKSHNKVPAGLVSGVNSLPGLQPPSLCVLTWLCA